MLIVGGRKGGTDASREEKHRKDISAAVKGIARHFWWKGGRQELGIKALC